MHAITKLFLAGSIPLCVFLAYEPLTLAAQTIIEVTDGKVPGSKRLGINIGARSRWSSAQILKNLIDNPGFEAGEFATVALAAPGSDAQSFRQAHWDTRNGGQPAGFWNGGEYEIVWGAAEGRSGTIVDFRHDNNAYLFQFGNSGIVPAQNDVMLARTALPGIGGQMDIADPNHSRPGSPGTQSLRLSATGTRQWDFYMDSFWRDGDRSAGKQLPIRGEWHIEFWVKGSGAGSRARVRFFREGEAEFINEEIELSGEWQKFERDFTIAGGADPLREYSDEEYHPILGFRLEALAGEQVWFDDVALYAKTHTNPTVFSDTFVQLLKELRPGILRNWSNQLGASLDNQLAGPWARKTHGYAPGQSAAGAWAYSLHEFLELCLEIGAEPWYVVPPTLAPEDLRNLIEYLAAPAEAGNPYAERRQALGRDRPWLQSFNMIHLEYGNELWGSAMPGDPFQGASLNGGVRLGAIASGRFAIMKQSPFYNGEKLRLHIGGQAGYAGRQTEIEENAGEHDAIALAPYFGILDDYATDEEIYYPLFAAPFYQSRYAGGSGGAMGESRARIDAINPATRLSIYEINFHTTHGDAPIGIRNDFLTGLAGGIALPLSMLLYQRDLGITDQCAFSALGYSFRLPNGDYARLWGMLRDLEATGRKRPTWLGVELANRGILEYSAPLQISGDRPRYRQAPLNGIGQATEFDLIQAFAFKSEYYGPHTLILFNLSLHDSLDVQCNFNGGGYGGYYQGWAQRLSGNIHTGNEDEERLGIADVEDFALHPWGGVALRLPPVSMTVVTGLSYALNVEEQRNEPGQLGLRIWAAQDDELSFELDLPVAGATHICLSDVHGRRLATLHHAWLDAGAHKLHASLRDIPALNASGLYFLRVEQNGVQDVQGFRYVH